MIEIAKLALEYLRKPNFMAKDYSELTQEELIDLIQRLEKKRKYGLVWDEEQAPEEVVQNCSKFLPVLKPLKVKGIVNNSQEDHVLIQGDNLPEYWSRVGEDGTHYLFLAQLLSKDLKYPVYSGQSLMEQSDYRELTFNISGKTITQEFEFKPYQSIMLKISPKGKIEMMDISFVPKDPIVRPKEKQRMNF